MSFTFTIVEKENTRVVCPVNEETGEVYVDHSYDGNSFVNQFKEGVVLEVSEPGHLLKKDLEEARNLLEIAKNKLYSPGRYEWLAEQIERFLTK